MKGNKKIFLIISFIMLFLTLQIKVLARPDPGPKPNVKPDPIFGSNAEAAGLLKAEQNPNIAYWCQYDLIINNWAPSYTFEGNSILIGIYKDGRVEVYFPEKNRLYDKNGKINSDTNKLKMYTGCNPSNDSDSPGCEFTHHYFVDYGFGEGFYSAFKDAASTKTCPDLYTVALFDDEHSYANPYEVQIKVGKASEKGSEDKMINQATFIKDKGGNKGNVESTKFKYSETREYVCQVGSDLPRLIFKFNKMNDGTNQFCFTTSQSGEYCENLKDNGDVRIQQTEFNGEAYSLFAPYSELQKIFLDDKITDEDIYITLSDYAIRSGKNWYEVYLSTEKPLDDDVTYSVITPNGSGCSNLSTDHLFQMPSCKIVPFEIREWITDTLNLVKYVALALVIVLGALDFIKAASSGEADQMKKSGQDFLKRVIAVVILFLVPVIVEMIINLVEIYGANNDCFGLWS